MKEAALLVLLMVTLNCSCGGASLKHVQEQKDVIDSLKIIYLEDDTLHLKWELLNPTGAVRGFLLTWNDGASDQQAHESGTEATIAYPSNLGCFDKLTVTVLPLNEDNVPSGTKLTEKFALRAVITNIILTPEENRISASWTIKCPCQEHTETVVIWEEVEKSHEWSCHFPSTARDTTALATCPAGELVLQPCHSYNVFIEPLDSQSSYTGIAGRGVSYTLEEASFSKLLEIEVKETTSRSATLLWQGPNPECPGTNYAVTYTETRLGDHRTHKGEVKVVKGSKWGNHNKGQLITASLHPSDNSQVMGHVDNLQPFSRYEFCVAAGNTVTNLVCQSVQTLEERPDSPSHISLTTGQETSTTIEVMWKPPSNINGNLTNYIVRWYRDSRHAGSHNTTKLSYTIVDAVPCVSHTIAVTAVNGAGEGMAAETEGVADNGNCQTTTCAPSSTVNSKVDDVIRELPAEGPEPRDNNDGNAWYLIAIYVIAAVVVMAAVAVLVVLAVTSIVAAQDKRRKPSNGSSQADSNTVTPERTSFLNAKASDQPNGVCGPLDDNAGLQN